MSTGGHELRLRFRSDDDGTGELTVRVCSNGFAGAGSAWFGTEQLERFAATLGADPLPVPGPGLAGGFFNTADGRLDQEHVGIDVYSVGRRGEVGVQVRLMTALWPDDRPESRHAVRVELLTLHERLRRFSEDLQAVVAGNAAEAVLMCGDLA